MNEKQQFAYSVGLKWSTDPRTLKELKSSAKHVVPAGTLKYFAQGFKAGRAEEDVIEPEPAAVPQEYIYGGDYHIEGEGGATTGWSTWKSYPEGWLRIEDSNIFFGGNQLIYPFPLTKKQMVDNDLLQLIDKNTFSEFIGPMITELESDSLWKNGQWLRDYENPEDRTYAMDSISDMLKDHLHVATEDPALFGEALAAALADRQPYPSRNAIEEFSSGAYATADDNATVLRDVMLYTLEPENGAPAGVTNYLTEREELDPDAGPPVTAEDSPLEGIAKIIDDKELVGEGYLAEYRPSVDDTPSNPQGVLISLAPGRTPDLIFDVAAKKWLVANATSYLRQYPGRFQQISFWEQETEF